jgi:hypothetical protein
MGKPKKRTSPRKTGMRRSHLVLKLARMVNGKSPVKARTTKRETGKTIKAAPKKTATKKSTVKAA